MTFYDQPEYLPFFLYVPGRLIQHMFEERYHCQKWKEKRIKEGNDEEGKISCFLLVICGQEYQKRFCLFFSVNFPILHIEFDLYLNCI